ncbi:hypothetical protein SGLAM104S_10552 [Streptomyces glaucescens]
MTKDCVGPGSDLTGQVALVTGGSTGLGRAIALGLASAGSAVVVAGRRREACRRTAADIAARTGGIAAGVFGALPAAAQMGGGVMRPVLHLHGGGLNGRVGMEESPASPA